MGEDMAAKVLEWIIIHWYFMFGILGIVFALGKFYGWMKANLVTHSDIKHMVTKNEIYKDDGGLIYMPATELNTKMDDMKKACLNHRENCSSAICKKIDNLKKDLDEIKDVSKGYQDGMQKTMLKISEHMGKTSEFMENHKLSMVRPGGV